MIAPLWSRRNARTWASAPAAADPDKIVNGVYTSPPQTRHYPIRDTRAMHEYSGLY